MTQKVSVRFQRAGPLSFYDAASVPCKAGDLVVVEGMQGLALAWVAELDQESDLAGSGLEPILRLATPEDRQRQAGNHDKEGQAVALTREKADQAGLVMKVLLAECNLEGTRVVVYFRAETRVDFRLLLRELSASMGIKVELRQVGARDETRLLGGLGPCGRPLCCATHLCTLGSVSMKMAKAQGLPLNPAKLSGICGRLLCCLAYEADQYRKPKAPEAAVEAAQAKAEPEPAPSSAPEAAVKETQG